MKKLILIFAIAGAAFGQTLATRTIFTAAGCKIIADDTVKAECLNVVQSGKSFTFTSENKDVTAPVAPPVPADTSKAGKTLEVQKSMATSLYAIAIELGILAGLAVTGVILVMTK